MADVVIVGGGVIGCACAYYLAGDGHSVTLLERDGVAGEASGAAAGILAPLAESRGPGPFLDFALAGLRVFPSLVESLREETGIDSELLPTPVLRLALSEAEERALYERLAWQRETGLPLQRLTGEEARALEPRLSPRVRAAVLSEGESQVSAGRLTQALAEAARRRGVEVRPSAPTSGFAVADGRVTAVRTVDGPVEGDAFVLAAGPWMARLARRLGVEVPVRPVRGQMLSLAMGSSNLRHTLWSARGYLVPKAGGHLYAGATVEDVGFRRRTTRAGIAGLRAMARALVPALRYAEVESEWAALRPGTLDGRPVIGPLPGCGNVFVAGGHFRNGILLGPITGQLVADMVAGRKPRLPLAPFDPARFG